MNPPKARGPVIKPRRDEFKEELERGRILSELKENGPLTVPELSERTGLPKQRLMWHLICMMKDGRVAIWGKKGDFYAFSAAKR